MGVLQLSTLYALTSMSTYETHHSDRGSCRRTGTRRTLRRVRGRSPAAS